MPMCSGHVALSTSAYLKAAGVPERAGRLEAVAVHHGHEDLRAEDEAVVTPQDERLCAETRGGGVHRADHPRLIRRSEARTPPAVARKGREKTVRGFWYRTKPHGAG